MRVTFDRTAYKNETEILTNFSETFDLPKDLSVLEVLETFRDRLLEKAGGNDPAWRFIAVSEMKYRDMGCFEKGRFTSINSPESPMGEFIGKSAAFTVFAISSGRDGKDSPKSLQGDWVMVGNPVKVNTKLKQSLAIIFLILAATSLIYSSWYYFLGTGEIFLPGIILMIFSAVAFYQTISLGRKIEFGDGHILYRNRHSQYETFSVYDVDHLAWEDLSDLQRLVFKYHKLNRDVIDFKTEKTLEVLVWAISNKIPVYTSHGARRLFSVSRPDK